MKKLGILLAFVVFALQVNAGFISGSYTGNGGASKSITGLGFKPEVVLVKGGGMQSAWISTSTMTAGYAKILTAPNDVDAPSTGMINSLDNDGFTVGASALANANGVVYYYTAFDDSDGKITVGSFTPNLCAATWGQWDWYQTGTLVHYNGVNYKALVSGNNFQPNTNPTKWANVGTCSTFNTNINVGYRPKMVWVIGEGTTNQWDQISPAQFTFDGPNSSKASHFTQGATVPNETKIINDHTATGFSVRPVSLAGAHDGPANGVKYNYVTFAPYAATTVSSYVGVGWPGKTVALSSPQFIMIKDVAGGQNPWFKTCAMPSGSSYKFTDAADATAIKNLTSTGFELGAHGEVNGVGPSFEYFALSGTSCGNGATGCGDVTLAASIPNQCVGSGTLELNNYNGTSAAGTWSISAAPAGSAATVSAGHTFNFNNTIAGSYTVRHTLTTVGAGCTAFAEKTFSINAKPVASISNQTICAGATATFDAGAGFSSYSWNTGATSRTISATTAGTYTATVTNANGCSASASATLTVNAKPAIALSNQTICAGATATFDAGAGFSSYSWNTGATSQSISATTPGTYTATVTNENGCSTSASADLTVIAAPIVSLASQTICIGTSTTFDAGAGYSSYSWSTGATTQSITVSAAGTYTVTVSNAVGCGASASATLTTVTNQTSGGGSTAGIVSGSYIGNGGASNPITGLGFKPEVVLVKSSGQQSAWMATSTMTPGYAKVLAAGEDVNAPSTGKIASLDADGFTVASSDQANAAGVTYYYTAFDEQSGMVKLGTFTPNDCYAAWVSTSQYNAGQVVSEGGVNYKALAWTAAGFQPSTNPSVWQNVGSCSAFNTNINLGYTPKMLWLIGEGTTNQWDQISPAQFMFDGVNRDKVSHFTQGGAVDGMYKVINALTPTGFSTLPVKFAGASTGGPAAGVKYNYVAFAPSAALSLGTYTGSGWSGKTIAPGASQFVMIKDIAGGQNTWFKTSAMPADLSWKFVGGSDNSSIKNFTANGIDLGVNGEVNGVGPSYEYFVIGGGSGSGNGTSCGGTLVDIPNQCKNTATLDLNNFNGNAEAGTWSITTAPVGSTATISSGHILNFANALSGSYTVRHTVTSTGAYAEKSFAINSNPQVSATAVASSAAQCNGSATLTPSGGVSPYTYVWSGSTQTSASATGLCVGNYIATVTDVNGCTATSNVTIPLGNGTTCDFTVTPTVVQPSCGQKADGSIVLTIGGNSNLTYEWNKGSSAKDVNPASAKIYSVLVQSATCKENLSFDVKAVASVCPGGVCSTTATLSLSQTTAASCPTKCDGQITATVSGITPTKYVWGGTETTVPTFSAACGKTYTVQAIDANKCFVEKTITVGSVSSVCDPFTYTVEKHNPACNSASTGSITLNNLGTCSVSWTGTSQTGASLINLSAGTYVATITCGASSKAETIVLTQPSGPALTLTTASTTASSAAQCNGSATVTPSGGVSPYTYVWSGSTQTSA
ncbi:MAG: hypothetical protein NT150_10785, partial [Bacteroidetes bacterium]|nr:hypothetical protein [Bacteroidota bacterium]